MKPILYLLSVFFLSGCSVWGQFKDASGITPETASVELIINASDILNVRAQGQSSPVIFRIHELTSPIIFRSLDFFALFENDKDALGDEYIKRYEYQIQPGEKLHEVLILDPKTRALGYSVAFRDMNGASWRKVVMIEERTEYFQRIMLEGNEMLSDTTRGIEQIFF